MAFLRARATAAFTVFSLLGSSLAVPLFDKLVALSPGARDLLKRSTPAAPHFVVYDDVWEKPLPSPTELKGYNVYALSFWLTSGATDEAQAWQELTESQRSSYVKEYNAAGISIVVSAFGSTSKPTSSGANAVTVASDLAKWVKQYGVQGVDVDYEDLTAFDSTAAKAEPWLISLTQSLRKELPQGQYILTHAPLAPWFSPNKWSGGGYLAVHKSVGSLIDWYNIQVRLFILHSKGTTEYTTCDGLITASSSTWPETALFQIAANGVDENKLVIGKPAQQKDATNGYMSTSALAQCVAQAHSKGWDAGVMVWEYPDAAAAWISSVRGKIF
ncbi:Glycoside hydrolase superfamily [Tylopilus felleus]